MAGHDTQRPLWVRLVVLSWASRQGVLAGAGLRTLGAAVGLGVAAVEWGSTSLLGRLALPLCLVVASLLAGGAAWSCLAVRWVDRNDKWA